MSERLRLLKNPIVRAGAVSAVVMGSIAADCRLGSERIPEPTPIKSGIVINKWYEEETYRWEGYWTEYGGNYRRVVDDDEDFRITIRNCSFISGGTLEPQERCIDRSLEVTEGTYYDLEIGDHAEFR